MKLKKMPKSDNVIDARKDIKAGIRDLNWSTSYLKGDRQGIQRDDKTNKEISKVTNKNWKKYSGK